MSILLKAMHRFSVNPSKCQQRTLQKTKHNANIHKEPQRIPNRKSNPEKKEENGRNHTFQFQTVVAKL